MRLIIEADAPAILALLNAAQIGIEGLEDPDTADMVGMDEDTVDSARALLSALCVQSYAAMQAGQ